MARNNHITNSFVAGEVSDRFSGRTDTQQYNQSCREIYNAIVSPEGGAGKRPGTRIFSEITRANGTPYTGDVKLIPFHATDGTRWQIALTNHAPDEPNNPYSGQSLEWKAYSEVTDNGLTTTNVGLATLAGAAAIYSGYYNNFVLDHGVQYAQAGDTLIVVNGRQRPLRIVYSPSNSSRSFQIRPYPDVGEWNNANLTSVTIPAAINQTFRQSAFLPPVVQSLGNRQSLNLAKGTNTLYTITPGTGSALTFTNKWVGKIFKFTRALQVVVILVTDISNATSIVGIPIGGTNLANSTSYDYGGATADQFYEESAWSDSRGWPSAVCFFESRLVFGGQTSLEPLYVASNSDEIWFSEVNDILEFDYRGLVTDAGYTDPYVTSDAFSVSLRSNVLNVVKWLSPKKTITSGTDFEEFVVQGPSPTKTIGIDNIQTSGETAIGSAPVQPVRVEAATIFLDRSRRKLRELAYNFDEDSLKASDLNILAPHMGTRALEAGRTAITDYLGYTQETYFVEIVRQAIPLGVVWALDNLGSLCGMTREREQNVIAWHYHEIAGIVDGKKPFVKSASVLQAGSHRYRTVSTVGGNTQGDELWMAVTRRVGTNVGDVITYVDKTFLERMERDWEGPTYGWQWLDPAMNANALLGIVGSAPVYMDAAIIRTNSVFVSGVIPLGELPMGAGAEVDILLNGVYIGKKTTTLSGLDILQSIIDMNLVGQPFVVMIGFSYATRITPRVPEVPAPTGSSRGLPRGTPHVMVGFDRTSAASIRTISDQDEENTPYFGKEQILFKSGANSTDPIPLYTGEKRADVATTYETAPCVQIESDLPLPLYVTHLVSKMVVYE